MEFHVGWLDDHVSVTQIPNRGRTPLGILLTQDQARQLVAHLTAMLAAGPPEDDGET